MAEFRFPRKHLLKFLKSKNSKEPSALYIHIPFCASKCLYCDFFSQPSSDEEVMNKFIDALEKEFQAFADLMSFNNVETVYIGGGTPSHLSERQLEKLFSLLRRFLNINTVSEFSFEANPESLTEEKVDIAKDSGVTRISLGFQSLNDEVLERLGRVHTAKDCYRAAYSVLDRNLSLNVDIIYAIEGEDAESLKRTLYAILRINPHSVSAYALTLKEGSLKALKPKSADCACEDYKLICSALNSGGFEHYEVSNWARTGFRCRHNLKYWRRDDYLGLGPSAASLIDSLRFQNSSSLDEYNANNSIYEVEELTEEQAELEELYLSLRTSDGISLQRLEKLRIVSDINTKLESIKSEGLLELHSDRVTLTEEGMFVLDSIVRYLID